jgi:hypothetical protein
MCIKVKRILKPNDPYYDSETSQLTKKDITSHDYVSSQSSLVITVVVVKFFHCFNEKRNCKKK